MRFFNGFSLVKYLKKSFLCNFVNVFFWVVPFPTIEAGFTSTLDIKNGKIGNTEYIYYYTCQMDVATSFSMLY